MRYMHLIKNITYISIVIEEHLNTYKHLGVLLTLKLQSNKGRYIDSMLLHSGKPFVGVFGL